VDTSPFFKPGDATADIAAGALGGANRGRGHRARRQAAVCRCAALISCSDNPQNHLRGPLGAIRAACYEPARFAAAERAGRDAASASPALKNGDVIPPRTRAAARCASATDLAPLALDGGVAAVIGGTSGRAGRGPKVLLDELPGRGLVMSPTIGEAGVCSASSTA